MKNKLSKGILIALNFSIIILLSGCWDYIEVERRGYVLGIAIDIADEKDIQESRLKSMQPETGVPKYVYTIQIPVIGKTTVSSGMGEGSGSQGSKKTWNLRVVGNSFFEMNRECSTRLDYLPFYEHVKVIVISEEAARQGIYTLLDFELRDNEMRRRTKVFITPGKAYNVLEVTPNIEDYASMYLKSLPNNAYKTSQMLHVADFGTLSTNMHSGNDSVLPKVIPDKKEIKDAGCAVFKKDKMVGWLDEIQTNYLKWIRDYVLGGVLTIESPDNSKKQVCLEIKTLKTEVKPVVQSGEITFNINSKGIFNIVEINHNHGKRAFEEDFIKEVERIAEKKAEKQIRQTIEYVQNEYGTDIVFFHKAMERYEPDTWDEVKDDWDNVFSKVKTNINVSIKIDQVGLIK